MLINFVREQARRVLNRTRRRMQQLKTVEVVWLFQSGSVRGYFRVSAGR
jgi:dihydroxyacetone kinase-like predicted kinase